MNKGINGHEGKVEYVMVLCLPGLIRNPMYIPGYSVTYVWSGDMNRNDGLLPLSKNQST